jgi:hypothetical protein
LHDTVHPIYRIFRKGQGLLVLLWTDGLGQTWIPGRHRVLVQPGGLTDSRRWLFSSLFEQIDKLREVMDVGEPDTSVQQEGLEGLLYGLLGLEAKVLQVNSRTNPLAHRMRPPPATSAAAPGSTRPFLDQAVSGGRTPGKSS